MIRKERWLNAVWIRNLLRRRRLALTAAAAWGLLLISTACGGISGSSSSGSAPLRIALITPAGAGELAQAIRLGAEAAAKESGAALVAVEAYPPAQPTSGSAVSDKVGTGADASRAKGHAVSADTGMLTLEEREQAQIEAVARALKQGASALIVDPMSEHALTEMVRQAAESGAAGTAVPVIVLNDEFPVEGIASVISIDHEDAGRQAGEAMAELLHGSGTVVLLGSDPLNHPGLARREQGIMEALGSYPEIEVLPAISCGTREECGQKTARMLDRNPVNGIIALQEMASLGAADELNRRESAAEVNVVAFGSEQQQLAQLQEGVFQQLIVQNGFSAGYLGLNQAVARLRGGQTQTRVTLETKLVGTDNMFWMDNQKLLFPFVQ
ncbi:substrate-binding domain-containing protein [Paenibacillus sp. FSL W8-0426]|uniref:substrate-binding domain-containing protein n=1 Tax=Paenibacillus sp. FSL W8-0426 TaxID=2921714 RepID=UPI0030DCCE96